MFGLLEFQQPSRFWWLLVAVGALAGYLWLRSSMAPKVAKRLTTLELLEKAERKAGNRWRRWLPLGLSILVLAALFAQWAEPVATTEVRRPARIVLAIDNSLSTGAVEREDGATRLERIQAITLEIVESARNGDEVALVTFADEAIQSVSPTTDGARLEEAISSLEPEVETDLGGALLEADRLVRSAPAASHVIVLSDGVASTNTSVERAVEQLKADKIAVTTVLVGTEGGFTLEGDIRRPFGVSPDTMQRIAESTGGNYVVEQDAENLLEPVYSSLDRSELSFEIVTRPVQWFTPLALVAVLLAALAHLRVYRTPWSH